MTAQPMFPLQSALLPGEPLPLRIFEPRYSQLVRDCLEMTDPAFGVVLITRGLEVFAIDDPRVNPAKKVRMGAFNAQSQPSYNG